MYKSLCVANIQQYTKQKYLTNKKFKFKFQSDQLTRRLCRSTSLVYLFIYLFMYVCIYLFMYLCIYLFAWQNKSVCDTCLPYLQVPLTHKDNEEPQSNETKELAKEISCDHQTDNKSPHNSPVPSEQNNCTRTLVCDGLPSLTPVEELNHFSAAPPPCLCTVYIKNAENLLKPESTHSYQTDPILIPRESKSKIGHKTKILVQVSSGHLSLAIILTTEGSHGRRLSWPFSRTILFGLENMDKKENRERGFKCYGNGLNFKKCLGRPQYVENAPIGIRHFLPVQALKNGFITSNTQVLHCLIFSRDVELRTCTRQLSSTSFLNKKCLLSSFTINID